MTDGTVEPTITPTDLYKAIEQTRSEFAAMSTCDLLPLNVNPVAAAGRVRVALRNVNYAVRSCLRIVATNRTVSSLVAQRRQKLRTQPLR